MAAGDDAGRAVLLGEIRQRPHGVANDGLGNRRIAHLARRILKGVRANDIIMLHDVKPRRAALFQPWLQEVDQIIAGIKARDLAILPLADLIGRPVMVAAGDDPGKPG